MQASADHTTKVPGYAGGDTCMQYAIRRFDDDKKMQIVDYAKRDTVCVFKLHVLSLHLADQILQKTLQEICKLSSVEAAGWIIDADEPDMGFKWREVFALGKELPQFRVSELKNYLRGLKLKVGGKKMDLIGRIRKRIREDADWPVLSSKKQRLSYVQKAITPGDWQC